MLHRRVELVRAFCEDLRPFKMVGDRGFKVLMITGRPGYTLPSPSTVSRDIKEVFSRTRKRLASQLQASLSLIRGEDIN